MNNKVSIICPFYNEEKGLRIFCEKLFEVIHSISDIQFQLIFINNASEDNSLNVIKGIINTIDSKNIFSIKVISFTRNFGYQKSLLAGYNFSDSDASIVIDTDLEDPPYLIKDFINYWKLGYEIVYGKRIDRHENFITKLLRNLFYKTLGILSDFKINYQMAEFCLVSKRVRDVIVGINYTFTFFRSEIAFSGYRSKSIDYKRNKREFGKTKYNIFGMIMFAIAGFLTTSTFSLRFFSYSFFIIFLINLFVLFFFKKLILYIITFNLIYIFLNLAVLSLYIARIYQISINRPAYIIDYNNSIL
jgi:dolichol-phosphate mannosyltransferase